MSFDLRRWLVMVPLMSAVVCLGQTKPMPGNFTIGKETTAVDGPLMKDGTIDYVQAINDILGKGILREQNGAIALLQATANERNREFTLWVVEELSVTLPTDKDVPLEVLDVFASDKQGRALSEEESAAMDKLMARCKQSPWKANDAEVIAEWIDHSEKGLALVGEACTKPHCFLPWVAKTPSGSAVDAIPPLANLRTPCDPLMARAMLRMGKADLAGALADLRTIRKLSQFAAEERTAIGALVAVAIEASAMRGYAGIATSGLCTAEDLKLIRRELLSVPEVAPLSGCEEIEELLCLDCVMMCIRGDADRVLLANADIFDVTTKFDHGNLANADWDRVMKAVRQNYATARKDDALPFDERMKRWREKVEAAKGDKRPSSFLSEGADAPTAKQLEEFLKLRDGESRAAYSERFGRWIAEGDPGVWARMERLQERGRLDRELAGVAISLAEYHLAHGAYPEGLKELGEPVLRDTFSGGEVIYRRDGAGFVLYSVSFNEKDDKGEGDDRPFRAEK